MASDTQAAVPTPPPAYSFPASAHPPAAGPSASDPDVVAAAVSAQPPPPFTYNDLARYLFPRAGPSGDGDGDGDPVPHYDDEGINSLTDARRDEYHLPLTSPPTQPSSRIPTRIYHHFTSHLRDSNEPLIAAMLAHRLVHPDIILADGSSALGEVARGGNLSMAKLLVSHGADVDLVFVPGWPGPKDTPPKPTRTALLLAAEAGHLGMVKYLVSLGADDGFLASDGQLALRLAADNKHSDVVAFLPVRRGGGFLRFKANYARQLHAIKRILAVFRGIIVFLATDVPKFFLWYLPKAVLFDMPLQLLKSAAEGVKWAYERRAKFPAWCRKMGRRTWFALKRVPGEVKKVVVAIPGMLMDTAKRVGRAAKVLCQWVWKSVTKISSAVARALASVLSACHTALLVVVAYVSRLRNVTLRDLAAGLSTALRALLAVPAAAWRALRKLQDAVYTAIVHVLDMLGAVLYCLAWLLVQAVVYVPKKCAEIVLRLGSVLLGGAREVLVWWNPKRV